MAKVQPGKPKNQRLVMRNGILSGLGDGFRHAMENPFGIDFRVHNNNIYIPFGSAINCLGYNDFLERIIGVARVGFALVALVTSESKKDRCIAAGHIFSGILEMMGSFELYLLIIDTAFTVYNISNRVFRTPTEKPSGTPIAT